MALPAFLEPRAGATLGSGVQRVPGDMLGEPSLSGLKCYGEINLINMVTFSGFRMNKGRVCRD